jgi:hypothetical protein
MAIVFENASAGAGQNLNLGYSRCELDLHIRPEGRIRTGIEKAPVLSQTKAGQCDCHRAGQRIFQELTPSVVRICHRFPPH